MKILFVTSQPILINSSANLRNIALIRGLIELGHEVKILNMKLSVDAANFDNSMSEFINENDITYIKPIKIHNSMIVKKENKENLVLKLKTLLRKSYLKFSILDSLSLSRKRIKELENKIGDFDIIISSSDLKSSHLFASEYIKKFGTKKEKWVQYWGDPLTIDVNSKSQWPRVILKYKEYSIIKRADNVIYVSPYTLIEQQKLFPSQKNKMGFVPVGYINKRDVEYKRNNINLIFGYFGDYPSNSRNIEPLYSAVDDLDITLKITGNSDLELTDKENVVISKRKPYEIIQTEEDKSDVLICLCNSAGTQIPGKIYHYSALNKPILVIKDGEGDVEEYLKKYDFENKFIYCDNDSDSIKEKINFIIENYINLESKPLDAFSSKKIAESFLKEIGDFNG